MVPTTLPSLDSLISSIATAAVALLLVVNGAFVVGIFLTRNRRFVDRWTKPLLMADVGLLGAAVGAPVIGAAMKLGIYGMGLLGVVPAAQMAVHK